MFRRRNAGFVAIAAIGMVYSPARAIDQIYEYSSFETGFQQPHFNILNYPSLNGHYLMTSTDGHRPEMVSNGNTLAEFYNWVQQRYDAHATKDGNVSADEIDAYVTSNSNNNGPKPNWLIMNEISSSLWSANAGSPSLSTYRTWLIDCVTRLHDHYGYNVVMLAPFQNPGANNLSWQALSQKAYVGIECYLSGTEVMAGGTDYSSRVAWATSQYQASKQSYLNRGVPASKLMVIEHVGNTNTTYTDGSGTHNTGWGRAGLASASEWDSVLQIRNDAIRAVGFEGFMTYAWGNNAMGITQAEQLQHEYWYRTRLVMPGQQPQWLVDAAINVNGTAIPLSWGQELNWVGGVPNTAGAVANFYRTNTTSRTITLDGARTVGILTFNSPSSYALAAGAAGSLTLDNGANPANVILSQGTHTISANVSLLGNTNFTINASTLTISGALSGAGSLTKDGVGTLALTNSAANRTGITTINAGALTLTADTCLGLVPASFTSNAITLNGGTWRNVGGTAVAIPANRGLTVLSNGGTLDFSSSAGTPSLDSKITGTGTLSKMGVRTLSVTSNSAATFSGNLQLKQGRVNVNVNGSTNALGTGTLILAAGNGDVAQLGIGGSGGISELLQNPISLSPTGNGQNSFEINDNNTLTLAGVISGAGALVKGGGSSTGTQGGSALSTNGTLILSNDNTYTGGTTVRTGTLAVKRLHENNPVSLTGGTLRVLDSAPSLPAHPAGDDAAVSRPSSLSISNNGAALGSRVYNATLDLGNNDLILDYSGASPLASFEDMLRAGYNNGDWLGKGITSSSAAADPGAYVLAIADNAQLASPFGAAQGGDLFSGKDVDLTTVLVKFTHRVDLNLDGLVTDADAIIFSTNFENSSPANWSIGDLNYDGLFTDNDAIIFSTFYETSLQHLPEPAGLTLLGFAASASFARSNRRQRNA